MLPLARALREVRIAAIDVRQPPVSIDSHIGKKCSLSILFG
jgi:hypothetical protein